MTQLSIPRLPQDVADGIKTLGPHFSPEILKMTWQLFEPHGRDFTTVCEIRTDVAYGDDARQTLNLFKPEKTAAPIVIYVPGGGFVGGSKAGYRRLGQYFAEAGYLTLIPDYRLAPSHGWPAGATDVASVIDWAVRHGEALGADTSQIYVFGQSAGATHVASETFDLRIRSKFQDRVRAVVLMSGIYAISSSNLAPNIVQYFGSDPSNYWLRSPLAHATNSSPRIMLLAAEFDPFGLGAGTMDLAKAIYMRDGICPPTIWMGGHNHISGVACIGSDIDNIGPSILKFFEGA
jgi:acetyl esterase/lipase